MTAAALISTGSRYEIRFSSTFLQGRTATFPCDACGEVDIDSLSEAQRLDYLFARIMVRCECAGPEIVARR